MPDQTSEDERRAPEEADETAVNQPAYGQLESPVRRDSSGLSPLFGPDYTDVLIADQENCKPHESDEPEAPAARGTWCSLVGSGLRLGDSNGAPAKWDQKTAEEEEEEEVEEEFGEENENLLSGFTLLRLVQLLNFDVYYIGPSGEGAGVGLAQSGKQEAAAAAAAKLEALSESRQQLVGSQRSIASAAAAAAAVESQDIELAARAEISEIDKLKQRQQQQGKETNKEVGLLEELARLNPLQRYVDSNARLKSLCRLMRICLSLVAIMISIDKTLSTILLCLISRPDIKGRPGNIGLAYEASDVTMSWFVLILINLSSMYILLSTVFNGHLLWELLKQRLFFVSRRFQYTTMLSMLAFIYLEYIVNISFINNLFGWSFEANDAATSSPAGMNLHLDSSSSSSGITVGTSSYNRTNSHGSKLARQKGASTTYNIHNSYSVLSNLETFVTEKDEVNVWLDILLTCFQFARGIIRVSPYITITYVTICLNEHIKTIRNQNLLTDSLKKKQRLRMVVKSRRANLMRGAAAAATSSASARRANGSAVLRARDMNTAGSNSAAAAVAAAAAAAARKKRVIFVTEASSGGTGATANASCAVSLAESNNSRPPTSCLDVAATTSATGRQTATPSPTLTGTGGGGSLGACSSRSASSLSADWDSSIRSLAPAAGSVSLAATSLATHPHAHHARSHRRLYSMDEDSEAGPVPGRRAAATAAHKRYLARIRDFDELEAYITNLYIFTGRLNRLMSRQGLAMFFIVHNLVITATLIVPEAISGGPPMATAIRLLVVLIGIVPFVAGQALNGQLAQLSKQIDRIIIQQQFIGRKRDNLVRIRELLHDIRVNCGGMLNFNVETGIKYLVVAFASAFFIEQEDYKLTRRH